MRKITTAIATLLLALALFPAPVRGGGYGLPGATHYVEDPPYRYVALTLHALRPMTVVERIDLHDSTIDRWWYLRGAWYLPAAAFDGSAVGIAEGKLILSTLPQGYPPKWTGFAVLDTRLFLRHPHRGEDAPKHAITRFSLPGAWGFDALSPDASTMYLIHDHFGRRPGEHFEVRALDLASGRLRPHPIVDPKEPHRRMQGSPVSRVAGRDGRWAYTLYTGGQGIFLHALDTVRGRAVCLDLPQLDRLSLREPFQLRLRLSADGTEILVHSRDTKDAPYGTLLAIDTGSFDVHEPIWMLLGLPANFLQAF